MTKKEIATLSLKILSLYAILKFIDKVASILSYLLGGGDTSGVKFLNYLMWAVPPVLFFICGIFLWFKASSLASSLFPTTEFDDDKSNASLMDIQIVAFSVVGLFVLAESFPDFVRLAVWYYSGIQEKSPLVGDGSAFLLRSVFGFWLLFGSRGIVNFIHKIRQE